MLGLGKKDSLIVHSQHPYNAEPPLAYLRASKRTDNAHFYVRSHGNIPSIDVARHRIMVKGRVRRPLSLSLDDVRRDFAPRTIEAVLQCAGNRRSDYLQVKPVSGDPWAAGAIGNAAWTGASLAEILKASGADEAPDLHVAFEACDDCTIEGHHFRYGVSIPIAKAMSPEVLLAYEMNGKPLAPEHGAPLRGLVPGFAGVRSTKWLATITVQDTSGAGFIQAHEYKLYPPDKTKETAIPAEGMTINAMPLNSAICEPADHAKLAAGTARIRGWAIATARDVVRVDVSADGGRHWIQAHLEPDPRSIWSWTFWDADIELGAGDHEIVARAWDCAGQTQPALPDDTWNFKGYLAACWHRIHVEVR